MKKFGLPRPRGASCLGLALLIVFILGTLLDHSYHSPSHLQNDAISSATSEEETSQLNALHTEHLDILTELQHEVEKRYPSEYELARVPIQPRDVKYYQEVEPNDFLHLDARFAIELTPNQQKKAMRAMFSEFNNFMQENHFDFWIAHGTLLGWYWNQQSFPWDGDYDVQVTFDTLMRMHAFNMTLYNGRYILDVNPNSIYRYYQTLNVIDARFIDAETGLFVDVTALSYTSDGTLSCKHMHRYAVSDIFPLKRTVFEGISVWRPNQPVTLLYNEYHLSGLTDKRFMNFVFDEDKQSWIPQ